MGVVNGQAVDQAVTNPAFLDADQDDTASGIITLANTQPASGATITNTQGTLNSLLDTTGATETVPATAYSGAPASTVTPGDDHELAIVALASKFDPTTGHTHDGTAGNGGPIPAASIASVPLKGYYQQGTNLTGVTGTSHDVTTELSGKSQSSGPTVTGLPTVAPQNRVILRQSTGTEAGDAFTDGLGNEVFGRVTYSSPNWTLSFYVNIAGSEIAYSFTGSNAVTWYYQELFNPLSGAPVYSELATIPSDNVTADVVDATVSVAGKVTLSGSTPPAIASTGSAGTANATVANADHTHDGVGSLGIFAVVGTPLKGAVELEQGSNVTMTYNSGRIRIASVSGGSGSLINAFQEVPSGTVDGVNAVFTLTQTPQTADALQVFVDGVLRNKTTSWTISGNTITFTAGNIPSTGQSVYAFYAGDSVKAVQETPTGTIDGVNDTFTLSSTPINATSLLVYIDGIEIDASEWTLTGPTLVFDPGAIPSTGQNLYCFYLTAGVPVGMFAGSQYFVEQVTLNPAQAAAKQVTLTYTPAVANQVTLDVIEGGPQFYGDDFTVSGSVLGWNGLGLDGILASGDKLRICYLY